MNKIRKLSVLIPLICNPVAAVELGPVKLSSQLNEPFRAVLDLNDVGKLELADIRFSLGDHAAYKRFNLDRPSNLKAVKFEVTATDNGGYELHLQSPQRVVEPILNVLIRVSEKQGSFFRHYTLLLDPPGSAPPSTGPTRRKAVARPEILDDARAEIVADEPARNPRQQTLLVRNDSISIIAQNSSLHEKYSVYQIMRAFYLANSRAFEKGNIDRLISGSRLVIPAESVIAEVPRQKAINFVYSVSRDNPGIKTAARTGLDQQRSFGDQVGEVQAVETPDAAAEGVDAPVKNDTAKAVSQMQQDVKAWGSMSDEFNAINSIVKKQNVALLSQNDALGHLAQDVDKHESQLLKLALRINRLRSLVPNADVPPEETAEHKQPGLIEVQKQVIGRQESQLQAINVQLLTKDHQILQLTRQLEIVNEQLARTVEQAGEKVIAGAVPVAGEALAERANDADHLSGSASRWWSWVLFLAAMLALSVREWSWRRRVPGRDVVPLARPGTTAASSKPEQEGALKIKHIEARDKGPAEAQPATLKVTQKSDVRLDASTADAAQIEIEVLLAYEQYGDAMQLLQLAREKFGDYDWIDCKVLEILAATNQCQEFLALFNEKRAVLAVSSPIAFAKIEKMRDKLCVDFNISAFG